VITRQMNQATRLFLAARQRERRRRIIAAVFWCLVLALLISSWIWHR
jgi:predicted nucleic acid-binding Zn ribbon protein